MSVRRIAILLILTAIILLSAAFIMGGLTWPVIFLAVITIIWFYSLFRKWLWMVHVVLFVHFSLGVYGLFNNITPYLIFAEIIIALAGWDLVDFSERLKHCVLPSERLKLTRNHLRRLLVPIAVGICLSVLILNIQIQLSLGWMIVLALVTALGLSIFISGLLKNN